MQGRLHYAASDNNNLSRNLQHGLQSRKMVFSSSQSNFASQITPTRSSTIIPTRLSASSTSQIIPTISPTQPRLNLDMASSNQIISDINEGSVDSDTSTDYVYAYDNAHTPKHHHTYVDYRSSPPYQSSDSSLSSGSSSSSNSYLDHQHHIETLTAPSETHTMIQNRNENSQLQPFDSLLSSGSISSSDSNLDQIGMRSSLETHSRVQNRDESLQTSTSQYTISNYIRVRLFKIIHHPIFFYMILTLTTYLTIVQLYTLSNYSCSSSLSSINTNTSTSLILRYPSTNFFFTEENGRESQRDESKPSPQAILIPAFQEGIIVPLVLYKQWWGDGMRLLEDVERLVVFVEEIRRGMEESDEGWDINKRNEKNERNENSENLGKEEKQWSIPKFFKPFLFPFGKNNSDFKFDAMEHQIEEEELREDEVELDILRKQIESIKGLKFNDIFLEIVEELVEDVEEGQVLGERVDKGDLGCGEVEGFKDRCK
ncbi:hypothetical protein EYC84_010527 [Monilinia fructicola]|uniref:Uncharacterized protein n=1 Tax=Monilinia fructicola TaxID=38448 RepID=A0A5M9J5J3_MONFR|nr:hypothetical protein EYC84_010527 [Monilinia fructicola]